MLPDGPDLARTQARGLFADSKGDNETQTFDDETVIVQVPPMEKEVGEKREEKRRPARSGRLLALMFTCLLLAAFFVAYLVPPSAIPLPEYAKEAYGTIHHELRQIIPYPGEAVRKGNAIGPVQDSLTSGDGPMSEVETDAGSVPVVTDRTVEETLPEFDAGESGKLASKAKTSAGVESEILQLNNDRLTLMLPGEVPLLMNYVKAPEGSFRIGSPSSEIGHRPWEEFKETKIGSGYYVGLYEVTQGQFNATMDKNRNPSYWLNNDDWPVDSVDWDDIMGTDGFIERMNRYLTSSNLARYKSDIPREAEWEYACRAGTTTAFNNNTSISNANDDPNLDTLANYNKAQGIGMPTPVGSFEPNAWGLYDMHGNLAEWCKGEAAYSSPFALRGGAWNQQASNCRSASRAPASRSQRGQKWHGFRLVLREAPE